MKRKSRCVLLAAGLLAGVATFVGGARLASADETWTLLPEAEWYDEFSPLYTNGQGLYCEGDPTPTAADPVLVPYWLTDPETGEAWQTEYIQNEAVISFHADVTAAQIRALLDGFDLDILSAYFDPDPLDPETSMSWFRVRIPATSTYNENVPLLLSALNALPEVEEAGLSEVARLCTGTPLYTDPLTQPNDAMAKPQDSSEAWLRSAYSGLRAAWYSADADLGAERTKSVVVVMDTGVDADHEDFDGKLYTRSGSRWAIGIKNSGKSYFGAMRPVVASPTQTAPSNLVPASHAPTGSSPDPLKHIELRYQGCAHGTAMAGIIGAKANNGIGTVNASGDLALVLPARMEMVGDYKVALASAPSIVKLITKNLSPPSALGAEVKVRTVYMGFAHKAGKRPKTMDDLLQAMRNDIKKSGQTRLWVAPAGQSPQGEVDPKLAYPAAILKQRKSSAGSNPKDPTVLGVTSVDLSPTDGWLHVSASDYFSPRDGSGQYLPLDRRAYQISAQDHFDGLMDVRDKWYSLKWRSNPVKSVMVAGYTKWDTGLEASGSAYAQSIGTGGFTNVHLNWADGHNQTFGTSVAAAQIAALSGALFSKFPDRTAAKISLHIQRSQSTLGATHTETVDGHTYQLIQFTSAPAGRGAGRIAGAVDVFLALTTDPPTNN